jgi:hypothetical protein
LAGGGQGKTIGNSQRANGRNRTDNRQLTNPLHKNANPQQNQIITENSQDTLQNTILAKNTIAPRGFEPLNENQQADDNKRLTENQNPVLSTSLDKIQQKYPELQEMISAWPKLPEHIKAAIKALVETVADV